MKSLFKINAALLVMFKPKFGFTSRFNIKSSPLIVDFGVLNGSPNETKSVFSDCTYHGVDIDGSMKKNCDYFVQADLENGVPSQIKKYKYDILILNHVLEHVCSWRKVLAELHEISNDSTVLYIEFPNVTSLRASIFGKYGYHFHNDSTHKSIIPMHDALQILLDSGWSIYDIGSKYKIRKGLVSMVKIIPYLLIGKKRHWFICTSRWKSFINYCAKVAL